jgi:hypothetical protein
MDSNYLLQVDYHEHRTDHPDYRHPYPPTFTPPDDPQFWPYAYPTAQSSLSNYPRYVSSQCEAQPDTAPPFVYDQSAQPADDFAAPTRLGIFDISAMHAPIGSAEPWGPRDEGQLFVVRVAFPFITSLLLPHNPRLVAIPRKTTSELRQPSRLVSTKQSRASESILPRSCAIPTLDSSVPELGLHTWHEQLAVVHARPLCRRSHVTSSHYGIVTQQPRCRGRHKHPGHL